jgi:cystathionine beta-lyase/cystathionine gamma-synthase
MSRPSSIDTLCIHAGRPQCDGDPLVAPLVQSTAYLRAGLDSTAPHAYSRVSNPTVDALEQALGALEQSPPAVTFASGLAAETALFLAFLRAGDHVICGRAVYGGTTRLLRHLFAGLGVDATFVDATRLEEVAAAFRARTRLVLVETPANPTLELTDLDQVARLVHAHGALLAVDNTFLTAALQRPLDHGADFSVYSTTKFVEGHGVALGGAIVARDADALARLRFVRKCTGGIQTAWHAWLTLQGLRTLPLRLARQAATAERIAAALAHAPGLRRVLHPSRATGEQARIARGQHRGGHGAVVTFELPDGAAAQRFARALELVRLAEHVGSVETLLTHPATMTHADVDPAARRAAGISDGLLRLSVGLEAAEDVLADLERGLAAVERGATREAPCPARA